MAKSVILIGGSGHAKVLIDCIRAAGDQVSGILDDNIPAGTLVLGVPVLGTTDMWNVFPNYHYLLAIGDNVIRSRISARFSVHWYTAIHPRAIVSPYAKIGGGTVILAGAIVNADATVGMHCIINSGALVEHDNVLENYVHISPNAALGGTVHVGQRTHIGIGASVRNNVSICSDCIIGAGAVVTKNILEIGVYAGVPARIMK